MTARTFESKFFLFVLLLLCALLGGPSASNAIRKGILDDQDPPKMTPRVFFFDAGQKGEAFNATFFTSKYPRCMIGAAHSYHDAKKSDFPAVWKYKKTTRDKFDLVDFKKSFAQDKWELGFRDLAVFWVGEELGTLKAADYTETELKKDLAMTEGTAKLEETKDGNGKVIGTSWKYTIPEGKAASKFASTIAGFGPDTTITVGNKEETRTDFGHKKPRYGVSNHDLLVLGKDQNPPRDGALYVDLRPYKADDVIICRGDSGGPAFDGPGANSKAFGVASYSAAPISKDFCINNFHQGHTAFHTSKLAGANAAPSNWEWLEDSIEKCGKSLMVGKKDGKGNVGGSVSPPQARIFPEPELDGVIDSTSGGLNNFEIVHFGQEAVLTAVPLQGDKFLGWFGQHCPCAGYTDPVCIAPYDSIGSHTGSQLNDESICLASFGAQTEPPSSQGVEIGGLPMELDAEVGTTAPFQATLTNGRSVPVALSSFQVRGVSGLNVLPGGSNCPATINPGQSCTLSFMYVPTVARAAMPNTVVALFSDGTEAENVILIGATSPEIVGSSEAISFGNVVPGTQATQSYSISNSSATAPVTINHLRITGIESFTSALVLNSGTCASNTVLSPGATCTFSLTYNPVRSAGATSARLMVTQDGREELSVPVTAEAFHPDIVQWDSPYVLFGSVEIGKRSLITVNLLNLTANPLTNLSLQLSPAGSPVQIIENTCGTVIDPDSGCGVILDYLPQLPLAALNGALVATYDGGSVTTTISGEGVLAGPTPTATPIATVTATPLPLPTPP
jgi:hypothetical protein